MTAVYSKEQGMTPYGALRPRGNPAYRQPPRERLQVPLNYSGHAIVDGEEQPLGTLNAQESSVPVSDFPTLGTQPVPRFDGLPRVSELGDSHRHRSPAYAADLAVAADTASSTSPALGEEESNGSSSRADAHITPPSSAEPHLIPSTSADHRVPPQATTRAPLRFGGFLSFGMEELLLLGLILFLLRESEACPERGDLEETVILLGLLLLLG